MTNRTRRETQDILDRFSGRRVAVVGDLILDQFVWGRVERISPEAPVPVVEVLRESVHPGGAANVAANLAVLGACPLLVGVVGPDEAGERLKTELRSFGIDCDGIVSSSAHHTTIKTRIMAHHQQVCRMDRESRNPVTGDLQKRLMRAAREAINAAETVCVSDYAKGVLTREVTSLLLACCRELTRFSVVDPKLPQMDWYRGASMVTPNLKEAEQASGIQIRDEKSLQNAARKLQRQAESDSILITRGEEGMTLLEGERFTHIPAITRQVFDVTGAGDTVVATLALAVAAGGKLVPSAVLANHAARVVVGKLGTAQATVEEIKASLLKS